MAFVRPLIREDFRTLTEACQLWGSHHAVVLQHKLPHGTPVQAVAELSGIVSGAGHMAAHVEVSLDGGKTWVLGQRITFQNAEEAIGPIYAMNVVEGVPTGDILARAVVDRETASHVSSGSAVRLKVLWEAADIVQTA